MGEWQEDERASTDDNCTGWCTALLWIVPAKVEGTWQLPQGELTLRQDFQMISGTLKSGSNTTPITNGRLSGDQVSFSVGAAQYTGRVSGNGMEGTANSGGSNGKWIATRVGKPAAAPSRS